MRKIAMMHEWRKIPGKKHDKKGSLKKAPKQRMKAKKPVETKQCHALEKKVSMDV